MSASSATNGQVTIGTTAALILQGAALRSHLVIQNTHASNDLFIGGSDAVTTSGATSGIKVPAGESFTLDGFTGSLFGIGSAAGTTVSFFAF